MGETQYREDKNRTDGGKHNTEEVKIGQMGGKHTRVKVKIGRMGVNTVQRRLNRSDGSKLSTEMEK